MTTEEDSEKWNSVLFSRSKLDWGLKSTGAVKSIYKIAFKRQHRQHSEIMLQKPCVNSAACLWRSVVKILCLLNLYLWLVFEARFIMRLDLLGIFKKD